MTSAQSDWSSVYISIVKVLILFALLFVLLLCGGYLFQYLEQDFKLSQLYAANVKVEQHKAELLKTLWAHALISGEDDWMEMAGERIEFYERQTKRLLDKFDIGARDLTDSPWSFWNSLFYAFTLITTIGFGNIVPETPAGRLTTIVYGLLGIPLVICLLDEVGNLLATLFKRTFRTGDINLGFAMLFVPMLTGTLLFGYLEELEWVDACYFSFVTFSSTGFGDIVPTTKRNILFSILYVVCSLALLSACFSLWKRYIDLGTTKLMGMFLRKPVDIGSSRGQLTENASCNYKTLSPVDSEVELSRIPIMNSGLSHRHNATKRVNDQMPVRCDSLSDQGET